MIDERELILLQVQNERHFTNYRISEYEFLMTKKLILEVRSLKDITNQVQQEKIKLAKALYKIAYLCADGTPLHEIAM